MMYPNTEYSYVGYAPCGCMKAAIIDDPARPREVAREVASWIRSGLTVERVKHQIVRDNFVGVCGHDFKADTQLGLFEPVEQG